MRLAVVSWRLWRIVRYEAEVSTAAIASAEVDLNGSDKPGARKPEEPANAREKARNASVVIRTLRDVGKSPAEKSLNRHSALTTMYAVMRELPNDATKISVPGIPNDEAELDAFDEWTAGLFRKAVEAYAAAARMTLGALLNKCYFTAHTSRYEANEEKRYFVERAQRWKLILERENRSRILLEPEVLDKVARYESGLERSFFRTLHEIQRLQAPRTGAAVPSVATIDVDMTVHPEGSS